MSLTTQFPDGTVAVWEEGPGNKKYKVTLYRNGQRWKSETFGDKRYQQYADQTPLGLYTDLNHYDQKRRDNYRARHGAQGYQNNPYSASWFSWHFLW